MGVKHTTIVRTADELEEMLDELILEYKARDMLLYTSAFEKATDAKSVRKHYPSKYSLFRPTFLIIDEYARFSDNKPIQRKVMELVESAGYVNIHVILSSQRPDAKTVLNPRIKANLLARICFTTSDSNNSLVILDTEGAEKLGKIQGRALFLDSDLTEVQVPYLDPQTAYDLLTPYRKDVSYEYTGKNLNESKEETTGSTNSELTNKIQHLFEESNRNTHF
jgi:DNA segregation ATPase FtsK/SpoIIIE-like protein